MMAGGGGWGRSVRSRQAGRGHPPSPIGQTGRRVLCSFEALKWTEFHHGHGDCSMSFVRNIWRDGPKNGEVGPCLECRVLCLEGLIGSCPIDPEFTDRQVIS